MRQGVGADRLLGMLHHAIIPPTHPHPLVLAWCWRYEIALLTGLPLALVALVKIVGLGWAAIIVTVVTTAFTGWPAARRRLIARAWCVLTPHRVRAACAQAGIHTMRGRLPTVLWCAPKSYGEQVLLWCPAGTTAEDFAAARQILAAACYASEIDVVTHPRYQHLVTLGVIRY